MLDSKLRLASYKKNNPHELTPQQFSELEEYFKSPESNTISDIILDFLLWCRGLPSRQERFSQFLSKKLPKTEGLKVLEVGCGRTARLSRFLTERGFNMTCIDPLLDLSYCIGFTGICDSFDYRTFDLSNYDFVIAQTPCDATEHVVRACLNQNKPFIMTLCGVPHKLISGGIHADVYDWHNYLLNISHNELKLRYIELDPLSSTALLKSTNF